MKTFYNGFGKYFFIVPIIVTLIISSCKKANTSDINSALTTTVTPPPPIIPVTKLDTTFLPNGVNLQPSYYNKGNVDFGYSLMKLQVDIKSVRINIEPTDSISRVLSWISSARANGYKIIACYHKASVLGSDDANEVMLAANWWKANYASFGNDVVINLINEWGSHNITAGAFATAYNEAIAIVRTVYSGPIIIDIPGYGQETLTAYNAIKTSSPVITDTKIVLSTHIYPGNYNQGRNHTFQPSDLDDLINTGRTCMVGEYGTGTGNCDWSGCVDYAKTKNWTVEAWAWNGDGNGLNMVSPSWAVIPTATTFSLSVYFSAVYGKL